MKEYVRVWVHRNQVLPAVCGVAHVAVIVKRRHYVQAQRSVSHAVEQPEMSDPEYVYVLVPVSQVSRCAGGGLFEAVVVDRGYYEKARNWALESLRDEESNDQHDDGRTYSEAEPDQP